MNPSSTNYVAVRVTHDSVAGFNETRRRVDEHVPLLGASVLMELVVDDKSWTEVEAVVDRTAGPAVWPRWRVSIPARSSA
jgi:hypothetical protein